MLFAWPSFPIPSVGAHLLNGRELHILSVHSRTESCGACHSMSDSMLSNKIFTAFALDSSIYGTKRHFLDGAATELHLRTNYLSEGPAKGSLLWGCIRGHLAIPRKRPLRYPIRARSLFWHRFSTILAKVFSLCRPSSLSIIRRAELEETCLSGLFLQRRKGGSRERMMLRSLAATSPGQLRPRPRVTHLRKPLMVFEW